MSRTPHPCRSLFANEEELRTATEAMAAARLRFMHASRRAAGAGGTEELKAVTMFGMAQAALTERDIVRRDARAAERSG